jgi:hypothetical protein
MKLRISLKKHCLKKQEYGDQLKNGGKNGWVKQKKNYKNKQKKKKIKNGIRLILENSYTIVWQTELVVKILKR